MSDHPSVKLEPALHSDLYAIAALECLTFYHENFSTVAFGPERDSVANLMLRARDLGKPPKRKGEQGRIVKAVLNGEIVGVAIWFFVTGRKNGGDDDIVRGGVEAEREEERSGWGIGANVGFCEDVLVKGDFFMMQNCQGDDYAKLSSLAVSPENQRRGIGSQLLEAFLEETDAQGLQAVLGASKEGRGLYERYGFVTSEVMTLKMWEYEGGSGMGIEEHVIMHRPAV